MNTSLPCLATSLAVSFLCACSGSPGAPVEDASSNADVTPSADAGSDVTQAKDAVGDAIGDSSIEADGGEGGDADAGACNNLVSTAPLIYITMSSAAPPTPLGGTIAAGTYFLSSATLYADAGSPPVMPWSERLDLGASSMDLVITSTSLVLRGSGSYATSGTTFTITETCPGSGTGLSSYTATTTHLTVFSTNNGNVTVGEFDKQ